MTFIIYSIWYWSITCLSVFTHFLLGLFCYLTPSPRINHRKLARFFIKIIAWGMGLKVKVDGIEHIPTDRACIFMPNHRSLIDILVMVIAVPYHFNFLAKKELFWVPFIGLDLVLGGDFLINRTNPREAKACLDKVEKRLQKKGWNMLIFPEGTRSTTPDMQPFKRGAFKLAVESNAPIIPCYIHGSDQIVKKNTLRATPGTVTVVFSSPIYPTNNTSKNGLTELSNQTKESILSLKEHISS